jgi:hypothetical protein
MMTTTLFHVSPWRVTELTPNPLLSFSMCENAAQGKASPAASNGSSSAPSSGSGHADSTGAWRYDNPDVNRTRSYTSSSSTSSSSSLSSPFFDFLRHHAAEAAAARAYTLKLESEMVALLRRMQQQYNVRVEWTEADAASAASTAETSSSSSSFSHDLLQRRLATVQRLLHHPDALAPIASMYATGSFPACICVTFCSGTPSSHSPTAALHLTECEPVPLSPSIAAVF